MEVRFEDPALRRLEEDPTYTVQAVVTLASASRKRLLRVAVQFDDGEHKELVLPQRPWS